MELFAPSLAIVDLETTGTHAAHDRITEVGIVRVDACAAGGPPRVTEWNSLVDPEVPIPAAIQALTGITDAMVRAAPPFAALAGEILDRLRDCVFVAHNARFDHGFLKHAFQRTGLVFQAKPLCTVRLSRRLFPEAQGHGLDAIVARHALAASDRHRALGDARAVWAFLEDVYRRFPADVIAAATRRILRIPSLPPQLPPDCLEHIPEAPGVYRFYGENPLPLYIGKSINLRERVAAHFTGDWQSETDLRLSQEIRRIEIEETAGELGALLREASLVKSELPARNRALRRKEEAGVLVIGDDGRPHYVVAAAIGEGGMGPAYGPFATRRGAREVLRAIATEQRLCWIRLGLEKRASGPCFQRQLHRCAGVCTGEESADAHDLRLRMVLAAHVVPRWPIDGIALVSECSANKERVDVHLMRDWCWLATARDDAELACLLESPPNATFDIDIARLLHKRWAKGTLSLRPAPRLATGYVDGAHLGAPSRHYPETYDDLTVS